jgi:secreted trypsin-like serine protease
MRRATRAAWRCCVAALVIGLTGLAVTPVAPAEAAGPHAFIVGGVTEATNRPWMAVLLANPAFFSDHGIPLPSALRNREFCSATLTKGGGNRKVLTAAHCVAWFDGNENNVSAADRAAFVRYTTVVIGRLSLTTTTGDVRTVKSVATDFASSASHPGLLVRDSAVATLTAAATGPGIPLAGPADASRWSRGRIVHAWGYGTTVTDGSPSAQLKRASLRMSGRSTSTSEATWKNGTTCSGDSGGPMTIGDSPSYRQVGLVSQGTTCDSSDVEMFQTVGAMASGSSPQWAWILDQVNHH